MIDLTRGCLNNWCRPCRLQPIEKEPWSSKRIDSILVIISVDYCVYITVLLLSLLSLLWCTSILLDANKWLGMIIYLINYLWLIICHFTAKCSTDYSCDMFTLQCIMHIIALPLSFLAFLGWCGTPLGILPYWETSLNPFSLVFPDGVGHSQHWDGCGLRARYVE